MSGESGESDALDKSKKSLTGLVKREKKLNIAYAPRPYELLDQYLEVEQIYKVHLSPTIVSIVHGGDNSLDIIKKTIMKSKLFGKNQLT
jgi:hypothetical protein